MKYLILISLTTFIRAYCLAMDDRDSIFNSTLRNLEKYSDYVTEQRGIISDSIANNVYYISFSTSDSIIDINEELDLFFLTFIHNHEAFQILETRIIQKYDSSRDNFYSTFGNKVILFLVPVAFCYKNNVDLMDDIYRDFLSEQFDLKIFGDLNDSNREVFMGFLSFFLLSSENNLTRETVKKILTPTYLSYLNSRYTGFSVYPLNLEKPQIERR